MFVDEKGKEMANLEELTITLCRTKRPFVTFHDEKGKKLYLVTPDGKKIGSYDLNGFAPTREQFEILMGLAMAIFDCGEMYHKFSLIVDRIDLPQP